MTKWGTFRQTDAITGKTQQVDVLLYRLVDGETFLVGNHIMGDGCPCAPKRLPCGTFDTFVHNEPEEETHHAN